MSNIIIAIIPLLDWTAFQSAVAWMRQSVQDAVRLARGNRRDTSKGRQAGRATGAQGGSRFLLEIWAPSHLKVRSAGK